MRTANKTLKIFSAGPCGQLQTLQKYFRDAERNAEQNAILEHNTEHNNMQETAPNKTPNTEQPEHGTPNAEH